MQIERCKECGACPWRDVKFCQSCGAQFAGSPVLMTSLAPRVSPIPPRRSGPRRLGPLVGITSLLAFLAFSVLLSAMVDNGSDFSGSYDVDSDHPLSGGASQQFTTDDESGYHSSEDHEQTTTTMAVMQDTPDLVALDRWVLVLHSLPKHEGDLDDARGIASSIGSDPRLRVVDSDATPGFNGGYWVTVASDYSSREEAVVDCSAFGRSTGGACYPTRVGDGAR